MGLWDVPELGLDLEEYWHNLDAMIEEIDPLLLIEQRGPGDKVSILNIKTKYNNFPTVKNNMTHKIVGLKMFFLGVQNILMKKNAFFSVQQILV